MTVFKELKRRNVFKVATAYLITAWLIIQIVTVLEPHLKLPEWVTPVIIVFLVVGFPIACLFAWAFELTPEGIKRSKEVVVDDSITNITGRKLDFGIIAAMAIAVVFLTHEAYFSENNAAQNVPEINSPGTNSSEQASNNSLPEQVTSIAVLPFVNMSNDPEQEYFSDGLSEELLNVLARIKQLKVAARTSSFFFKNKNMDIKEIANKLGVEHVLEGSVRKSGTKLRVTAQLIQADNGYHLWSATYNYEIDDVFKIQDEISAAVVTQLKLTLLNEQESILTEHGTFNPEAQDAYLLGRYHLRARTPDALDNAEQAFKKSLAIDPNNQLAISGLLDTYSAQEINSTLTMQDYLFNAGVLLQPFMDKANQSAEIYTSLGDYYANKAELIKAEEMYQKAINISPNYADAYMGIGILYAEEFIENSSKSADASKKYALKALSLDPFSPRILTILYYIELLDGRLLEAENYLNRMLEVNPNETITTASAVYHFWTTGRDWDKAWQIINSSNIKSSSFSEDANFYFYLALGDINEAQRIYENITSYGTHPRSVGLMLYALSSFEIHKGVLTEKEFINRIYEFMEDETKESVQWLKAAALVHEKKYDQAINLILKYYPHLLDPNSKINNEVYEASYLAFALRKTEDPRAEILNKKIRPYIESVEGFDLMMSGIILPTMLASIGDNERAIQALHELFVENDFYDDIYLLDNWVLLDDIKDDPKFIEIINIAKTKLSAKVKLFKNEIKPTE
ncbi:hypothetical protein RGQ13_16360 [Thalassotalea psychrophila]|uniref:Tetratricopeptide repeat protein n=1 Tax=Thalassotalea psychrophila TaxID=3065647 RepID=A0ABY9TS72_9GAMM|nr:hypothetical protein RGQ13_16360 [Colwelliaceae bacterium SQ149]